MRERIGEVIVHLSINKQPLKSGKHALYVRVQHKNANRYYTAHTEMSMKEWEKFEKCPENDHPAVLCYRAFVDAANTLVRAGDFSFTLLSQITSRSRRNSIQDLIRARAEELTAQNKHATAAMYDNLCVRLDEYLGRPTPVTQLTHEKCRGFIIWLQENKKNGPTAVSIKARNLTAVLNQAVKGHLIPRNPMDGIRKPPGKRRNLAVSTDSLQKLLRSTREEIGEEFHWLCYWRALYYGNGMNVKDLLRLRRTNIDYKTAEIVFMRQKTMDSSGAEIHVPITAELNAAIAEISGGKDHLVPNLDGYKQGSIEEYKRINLTVKNINKHLRGITRILRIPEKITTYTARHCFATVLQRKHVPVEFISAALGHSSIRTTQNYLDGYTEEQRRETARLLSL